MMLFRSMLLSLVLIAAAATPSLGDLVIHIDMDPSTSGIQTSIVPSGNFDVDLVIELTEFSDQLAGYSISVDFDQVELDFVSGSVTHTPPTEFPFVVGAPALQLDGTIGSFAATFDDGGSLITGPTTFVIGSLSFEPVALDLNSSDVDIVATIVTGFDGLSSDGIAANNIVPVLQSGSVSAVPEPGAFLLVGLISGGTCVIRWSRRRFSKRASD